MSYNVSALGRRPMFVPVAIALPFVLSAALYLSVIFAVFSALPIVYGYLRLGRLGGLLCAVVNLAIVWALAGQLNAAIFFIFAVMLGTAMAEAIKLRLKLEWAVVIPVIAMAAAAGLLTLGYSAKYRVNPVHRVEVFVDGVINKVVADIEKYKASSQVTSQDLDRILMDPQAAKKNILNELPSFVGITLLLVSVACLLLMVRLNPGDVRSYLKVDRAFFRTWKAPEQMVWPALIAGFCLVIEVPYLAMPALNVFKMLMAIYAIQGLAIMSFLFQSWNVRPALRPAGYVFAVAVLLPLVISLGFFDLWFDFREKLKK